MKIPSWRSSARTPKAGGGGEIAFDRLWQTLSFHAAGIRPTNIGNFLQQDGYAPEARSSHFAAWSNLRSWLFRAFSIHAAVLYLLVAAGCVGCLIRPALASAWPLYPVALVLIAGGVIEFACAALLDCLETARHLFLFHTITDMLILLALASLPSLRGLRTRAGEELSDVLLYLVRLADVLGIDLAAAANAKLTEAARRYPPGTGPDRA